MDTETLKQSLRFLYEGRQAEHPNTYSTDLVFSDPLVLVQNQARVEEMFRKLNKIFPATEIASFEASPNETSTWLMQVHYKKTPTSRPKVFKSRVNIEFNDGLISRITEHWQKPLKLSGDGRSVLSRGVRSGLGRLFC